MAIPRLAVFLQATAKRNKGLFEKARGSNIAAVDIALSDYWTQVTRATAEQEIDLLHAIVKACTYWLKKKYHTQEFTVNLFGRTNTYVEQFTRRRREIKSLADEALNELYTRLTDHGLLTQDYRGKIHFERNKVRSLGSYGWQRKVLKSMGQGYLGERQTYLQSGKTKAISGSGVHQTYEFMRKKGGDLEGVTPKSLKVVQKDVNHLTPDDFRLLDEIGRKNMLTGDVNYLKKDERFRFLAICNGNGELADTSGNLITTHDYKVTAYAMDRYGNLFAKDADPIGDAYFFNHSSFNAGNDVISAGTLTIAAGVLQTIDNNSGHYKPNRVNLHNCVDVLAAEGVDLTHAIVNLYVFPGGHKEEHRYQATAFLANPNSVPMMITPE